MFRGDGIDLWYTAHVDEYGNYTWVEDEMEFYLLNTGDAWNPGTFQYIDTIFDTDGFHVYHIYWRTSDEDYDTREITSRNI